MRQANPVFLRWDSTNPVALQRNWIGGCIRGQSHRPGLPCGDSWSHLRREQNQPKPRRFLRLPVLSLHMRNLLDCSRGRVMLRFKFCQECLSLPSLVLLVACRTAHGNHHDQVTFDDTEPLHACFSAMLGVQTI
ncbi:hypothetical protein PYCCODRAFT_460225 [Trametes coccinea BRFM310]|uniref:Uncharacterized protein n=1 Tax=Trametes coccinea (strain BRFM310) TaxID=1353009 RepID=A0A1Y2ILF4_TRAC3|nr:hypothetical protein PYCCODRAFT_460225 [Trametes coccinea BRFM310]